MTITIFIKAIKMRCFFLFFLFCISHSVFANQQRIALVIGNSAYSISPLANPVNDADSMAQVLEKLGFKVIKGKNLTRKQMRNKIREFGNAIKTAEVGLFYFAGHGIQFDGENYLIPIESNIQSEDEVIDEAINTNAVLRKMEYAGNPINIVVLDACRNNPFKRSFRSINRGLTRIEGPKGSLIAYATAPGSVAEDGMGANGLYTKYLLKYMQEPIPLEKVFKKVRMSVSLQTSDRQIPWENSSLVGDDFYFTVPIINNSLATENTSNLGMLSIQSNVTGNEVNINGRAYGDTNLDVNLKPGVYFIEVKKIGYKTFEKTYTVVAGTEQVIYAKLKKNHLEENLTPIDSYTKPLSEKNKRYTPEQQRAIDLFNKL